MTHRGTREVETAYSAAFGLGHIRLPIQGDVAQPVRDFYPNDHGGGSIGPEMLAYNGELFNYDTASYRSDSRWLFERLKEVHSTNLSYNEILGNLDGFYSFAFADRRNELVIATDYLAQKPVYYMLDETGEKILGAASEMRGLIDDVKDHELDTYWISSVRKFRYYPMTDGRTWHKRIKTLFPGTMLIVSSDGSYRSQSLNPVQSKRIPRSWDVDKDFQKAALELRDLLADAVDTRVRLSDVPISVLLSGGIDSSAVYTLAKTKCEGINLNPFTFENGTDGEYVKLIDPNTKFLKEPGHTEQLGEILRINEGPVDLGSVLPQYHLGQAIKEEGFVVAISGDGADELFGGYRRAMDYDSQDSDVWSELVGYHLPRLDKMMMHSTVELRSPFLAKPIVEFALSLPWEWRQGKNLLKEAMRGIVPDAIIDRPKEPLKIGSVRDDKEKHTLALMNQWLAQEDKI
jgi:asparagine synthase (glutamine-hydrolysing)